MVSLFFYYHKRIEMTISYSQVNGIEHVVLSYVAKDILAQGVCKMVSRQYDQDLSQ